MIEALTAVLPIIIYVLLCIFLVIVIVLGIKLIITVDSINKIIKDVQDKITSLNSVFKLADMMADKISGLGCKMIDKITSIFNKVLWVKNGKDDDDYE